jgi:hypothetical protein
MLSSLKPDLYGAVLSSGVVAQGALQGAHLTSDSRNIALAEQKEGVMMRKFNCKFVHTPQNSITEL